MRTLLAATAGDVCELLHAPFCAISQVDGDDAVVAAVQGARSHRARPPGTRWRVSETPPARQAVATGRTVVLTQRDDPRLTDEQRSSLTGDPDLISLAFIPLQNGQRVAGLLILGDTRPRDLAAAAPQLSVVARLVALALTQDQRLEGLTRAADDLALVLDADLEAQSRTSAPEQVLRVIARRFAELCHAPMVDIYTIEGDTLRALVSWQHGAFRNDYVGAVEDLADWPLTRAAAVSGRLEVVASLDDPRLDPSAAEALRPWGIASYLTVPLLNSGKVIGIVEVFDTVPRDYAEVTRPARLLRGLGQIAAQTIANARVRRVLDANAERLEIINEASLDLASSLDLPHILDATARRLCAVAKADSCDVYKLRGRELTCEVSLVDGAVDENWVDRVYPLDEWRASRLAVDSRSVVNVLSTEDPRLGDDEREEMVVAGRRSALIVPLMVENRVIGIVELFASSRERNITADEIATAEAICRVAALAITNADLFRDLELRNRESELLNQVSARVGSSLDTSTIAAATIDELATLVPFTEACLVMGGEGAPWKVVYASSPFFGQLAGSTGSGVPEGFRERLHRERVVAADLDAFDPLPGAPKGPDKMRSLLVIGIWTDDQLSGALALLSPERDAFASTDHRLLTRVGTQLALSFKNAGLYETIKTMHVSNLKALISALNARDYYAVGHAARVAAYMLLLGRELGWPDGRLQHITEAAFLHDVGRIGIADDVLFKPGRLSDEETAELRNHPVTSAEIVRPLFSDDLVAAVRHHHEHWDGHGYPDGLSGAAIPEIARALCIVDSYDAMSFQRPHHAALSYGACLAEMERCRGRQFDPDMVTAFIRVLDRLDERRSVARDAAETAAVRIDPTALVALSSLGDEGRPEHARMAAELREVRDDYPQVRFLTTMAPGRNGWTFVCDPEEDPALRSHLGDPVDRFGAGNTDLSDAAERNVLQLDDFGVWVSGEAEIRDARGEQVGLVCADLAPADDWPAELGSDVTGHAGTFSAIVESATARLGRARVDAVTDGLTGLYNQRYFKQRLSEEVTRATEVGGHLALLFCDLDHFKGYNDRLGHTAGDRALRATGTVLLRSIRQVDLAARYGGEEFTVILIDTTAAGALDVAERIRAGVAALDFGSPDSGLTMSIGVASFPADATLTEELVDKADWAMYLAKRQGRDRVLAFQPGTLDSTTRTASP